MTAWLTTTGAGGSHAVIELFRSSSIARSKYRCIAVIVRVSLAGTGYILSDTGLCVECHLVTAVPAVRLSVVVTSYPHAVGGHRHRHARFLELLGDLTGDLIVRRPLLHGLPYHARQIVHAEQRERRHRRRDPELP